MSLQSPFQATAHILAEPSNMSDEVRIIATDSGRLTANDRQVLLLAAEELEHAYKLLIATQAALIESQQQRLALNDALMDARRRQFTPQAFPSLSTGWLTFAPHPPMQL